MMLLPRLPRALRRSAALIASASLVAGMLALAQPADAVAAETDVTPEVTEISTLQSDGPLSGIDALGRELSLPGDAPAHRDDRYVGVFYVLWHGSNDHRDYKNIYNNSETLAADPDAASDPASGAWPSPGHFAYWGEPLYGYYRSDDEWVMRRHLQLLAAADVDYLVLDTSNNELYKPQAALLMRLIVELQAQGIKAPQIAFMTHTDATPKMDELYRTFYAPDAPYRYPSTWFSWKGKPLILGDNPSELVKDFFTFRWAQWPNEPQRASDGWDWISFDRPQRANRNADGAIEQMAVSSAQNSGSSSIFSYTALEQRDAVPSRSKNWHDGAEDTSPGAIDHGYNFQEEWDYAIEQDPETVLVLEWNEWIAGNWAARASDLPVFYDVVDTTWNRDLEMMAGGYGDNYYLQLVDNIRRYKGVVDVPTTSGPRTIDLDGPSSQWDAVTPVYRDAAGDTAHRNHAGTDAKTYTNTSGRNDIVTSQVSYDDDNLYFRVTTAEPLTSRTDDDWMRLYLDVDGDKTTGWLGYDYAVNRQPGALTTTLDSATGDGAWAPVRSDLAYRVDGDELVVRVPRGELEGLGSVPRVDFAWWDNGSAGGDAIAAYQLGDRAPESRFSYVFNATGSAAPTPDLPRVDAPEPAADGWHRVEDGHATESKAFIGPNSSDWLTVPDAAASGGSHSYAVNPSARADNHYRNYVRAGFDGSSVRWVASTGPDGVQAEVFIDGLSQGIVSQYRSQHHDAEVVFEKYGLPAGQHEIWVVWETQSGRYTHDYFEYGVGDAEIPPAAPGENLALAAWASGSSFAAAQWFATNPAQLADGDPSTFWRASGQLGEWVELDLGRASEVSHIDIEPRGEGLRDVAIQVRDGSTWTTVHEAASITSFASIGIPAVMTDRMRVIASSVAGPVEVAELAVRAGSAAPEASETNWEFLRDTEGWTADGLPGLAWAEGGSLVSSGSDASAAFVSPAGLGIDAAEYGTLKFKLRNGTPSVMGTVRFQRAGDSGFSDARSVPVRLTASQSGGWSEYAVDLSANFAWTGKIDRIAIELGNASAGGASALDFVRFARDNAVAAWHFDEDAEGWTASSGPAPEWTPGAIRATAGTDAWQLDSPDGVRADITNHSVIKVRVQADGGTASGRVFFATEVADSFSASRSADLTLVADDGDTQLYEVDLAGVSGWSGVLDRLRLSFDAPEGTQIAIDSVRIEPFVLTELGTTTAWEFDDDAEGWGGAGGIDDFGWKDGGYIGGEIVHNDPQIYSPDKLWVDLSGLTSVNLRMQVDSTSTEGTLYYSTLASPSFSQDKSVPIPLSPDAEGFVDITLDMSSSPGWKGLLKQLRFDPAEGGGAVGSFLLDHLRLQDFTIAPITVSTTVGTAPELPATVTIRYANGDEVSAPVTWDAVSESAYAAPGAFTVRGETEGGEIVSASVTVLARDSAWEFDTSLEGWGEPFGIEHFRWAEGGYVEGVNIWYGDAQFFSPDGLGMSIDGKPLVKIGLQNKTAATEGTLYFATSDQPTFAGDRALPIPLVPNDDQIREYVLDFSSMPGWSGTLTRLRFDPTEDVTSGDFLLDYIRIRPASLGIETVAVQTFLGVAPELPVVVEEEFTDGTRADVTVTWDAVDNEDYAAAGTFDVAGTLADGRAVQATVTVVPLVVGWEFDTSLEGWNSPFGIGEVRWAEGGYLEGVNIWYGDAQVFSPDAVGTPLEHRPLVKIGLQNKSAATEGTLFFTTTDSPTVSADKAVAIPLVPNDDHVREYVLDLSSIDAWSGILKQFRFDPSEGVTAGDFLLDYVRLAPKPTTIADVAVTTVAGTAPVLPATVEQSYEDGSVAELAVTWSHPCAGDYAEAGSFTVEGELEDGRTVTAEVTVTARPGGGEVPPGSGTPPGSGGGGAAHPGGTRAPVGSPSIVPGGDSAPGEGGDDSDDVEAPDTAPDDGDEAGDDVGAGLGDAQADSEASDGADAAAFWWPIGVIAGLIVIVGATGGVVGIRRVRARR